MSSVVGFDLGRLRAWRSAVERELAALASYDLDEIDETIRDLSVVGTFDLGSLQAWRSQSLSIVRY